MSFNLTPIGHIRARLNLVHFKGAWELHMGQGATGCRPLTHGTMFINIQKLFSVISITAVILDGHLSFMKLIFRPKHWLWFSTQSSFTWHHFCHKDMNLEVHDQSACACQHMSFCGFHFEKSALFRLWARLQIKDNLWPKKKKGPDKKQMLQSWLSVLHFICLQCWVTSEHRSAERWYRLVERASRLWREGRCLTWGLHTRGNTWAYTHVHGIWEQRQTVCTCLHACGVLCHGSSWALQRPVCWSLQVKWAM